MYHKFHQFLLNQKFQTREKVYRPKILSDNKSSKLPKFTIRSAFNLISINNIPISKVVPNY